MTTYECKRCGMSVNATCAKCNEPLVNDTLTKNDGRFLNVLMITAKLNHLCVVVRI